MMNLVEFFEGMSKPMLRDVHARAFGKKGLLNNALIQSEVVSYFCDKNRLISIQKKLESWQKRCLNLIYHSFSRGLTFNELRLTVPVSKNHELQSFLVSMCREFVIWRTSSADNAVYYGFENFTGCFEIETEETIDLNGVTSSYGNLLDWHVCKVLALAKRGELKVNSNGSLHRRSHQACLEAFSSASLMSEKAAESELNLIFNFLIQNQWLEVVDSALVPTNDSLDFLKKNGFRLHQDILIWWIGCRFHKDRAHCEQLLRCLVQGMSISEAAFLFWVMDPSYRILERNKTLSWEYLPRPLRELWLLGLVQFQLADQKQPRKITAVSLTDAGRTWLSSSIMPLPEASLSVLPNFDVVSSTGTSPRILFILATLAEVKNDDSFLCFSLNKDVYLSGLRNGFPESEIEHFRNWIKAPENVASALDEWNASFYGAKVRTVRLLKIDDAKILSELSRFAHFLDYTEEVIPGYGFVLKPECEAKACEILENFGYCPSVHKSTERGEQASIDEWKKDFVLPWHNVSAPDYDLKDSPDESSLQTSMNATKYGSFYRKLDMFDLVKVLRYAKMAGTLLSAQIKDPAKRGDKTKEITFYVHSLHLSKSPFNADIQEFGTETNYPLMLNFIQEIKVLHKRTI